MREVVQRFDRILATFQPTRADDLHNGAREYVGWRGAWEAQWVIEDGPYAGQWAMLPVDRSVSFGWVPLADLAALADVDTSERPS